jgi:excinuclease ABC subunit B
MQRAMDETARRRSIQQKYNEEHGIIPQTIKKDVRDVIESMRPVEDTKKTKLTQGDIKKIIEGLRVEMLKAADNLDFEQAAELRDRIRKLEGKQERT